MRASPSRIVYLWLVVNEIVEDLCCLTIGNLRNRLASMTKIGKLDLGTVPPMSLPRAARAEPTVRHRTTN